MIHKCEVCDETFRYKIRLTKHQLLVHQNEKSSNNKCLICGRQFCGNVSLQNHVRIHEKEEIFTCKLCGFAYGLNRDLNRHINTIHPENKSQMTKCKILRCEFCPREFLDGSGLARHIPVHHNEKNVTCEVCGFVYANKSDLLNKHMIKLHPEKIKDKYQCEFCDNFYFFKNSLTKHMTIDHLKSKCEFCSREFIHESELHRHVEIHQKENNVTCEFCGFVYADKSDLVEHIMEVHPDYQCKFCDNFCGGKSGLTNHIKRVHPEKDYQKCELKKVLPNKPLHKC